ncbi:AraC family transcriptional regulator [Actinoplanes sp. NPDC049548]|uniref:AraC family transcriptional regulator n=1 Tax=Actinoplanes sp. NPDC049548 TaxID=3155152 RepID=UPI0034223265
MDRLIVQRFSLRSDDVEQVRAFGTEHFFPRKFLQPLGRSGRLAARFHLMRLGPITLCDARYGADVTLGYDCPDAYQVGVPQAGSLEAHQRDRALVSAGNRAAVSRVGEDMIIDRWPADCHQLVVKIEQGYLENQLQSRLGATVQSPLELSGDLDVGAGPGRGWAALVRLVAGEFRTATGMLEQPLITGRLIETLTVGLLLAARHPHREALARPAVAYRPPPVRRAVEAVEARPEHPFTVEGLADAAGVSVRTLQAAFRRYLGCTPMAYVRDVRLSRVHDELSDADPGLTTVTAVAQRWGFAHMGRFAAAYRARYHVAPSQTLQEP